MERCEGFGCGRRAHTVGAGGQAGGALAGARQPFAFPGTTPRYAPDRSVDIRHTRIEIQLDPAVCHIQGVVHHTVAALRDDTTRIALHADELTVDGVEDAQGNALAFTHLGADLTITLPTPLDAAAETTVTVRYHGAPRRGLYFIHPTEAYPDKPVQAWTQGQDEDSRFWFPCFDHPSEKMSTELVARVPAGQTVLSNGALVDTTEHEDGTVSWHWRQAIPHAAYLVTLVVAELETLDLGEGEVPLTALVPKGREDAARRAFGKTAAMVAHFGERYGIRFPYEKYAQVVVEDFIFGGMENTTATTMIDLILLDERAALDFDMDHLVAHELAHQWWGDLLTCRDWSHAWLNEGFATWSELVWMEEDKGADEAAYERLIMARSYMAEDGGEYRRPIVEQRFVEPIDLFDRHLYEKGGLVLHMLRQELGEGPFWRAIRTYAADHRGRTVVTENLRRAIEDATGRNLDGFFDQWVFGAGHPSLEVSWTHDKKADRVELTVKQTHKAEERTAEVFRFPVRATIHFEDGTRSDVRLEVERRDHTFLIAAPAAPTRVVFDPDGDVLAAVEVKQPAAANRALLASDAPVRARMRAAAALGKDPARENVEALAAALADPFWGMAAEAAAALGASRHPAARDALVQALREHAHPKVRRAAAKALGTFRHDVIAGDALKACLEGGDASLFVEASAAAALGRVRAPGAQALLTDVLEMRPSWGEAIRMGAIQGLADLGDASVVDTLVTWSKPGKPVRVRTACAAALATVGRRLHNRDAILEALGDLLDDGDFRLVVGAIRAARALGDAAALPLLARAPAAHPDGRVQRAARVAADRIRKHGTRLTEVTSLSEQVTTLETRVSELLTRLEKLEG